LRYLASAIEIDMHIVNLFLWLAMLGAAFAPAETQSAKIIAIAGLIVAALWQHATVRGFWRAKPETVVTAR
jgi:hypothetical protein